MIWKGEEGGQEEMMATEVLFCVVVFLMRRHA